MERTCNARTPSGSGIWRFSAWQHYNRLGKPPDDNVRVLLRDERRALEAAVVEVAAVGHHVQAAQRGDAGEGAEARMRHVVAQLVAELQACNRQRRRRRNNLQQKRHVHVKTIVRITVCSTGDACESLRLSCGDMHASAGGSDSMKLREARLAHEQLQSAQNTTKCNSR